MELIGFSLVSRRTNRNVKFVTRLHWSLNYFWLKVDEWHSRAAKMNEMCSTVNRLFQRLTYCNNRELLYDLYSYIWDMRGVVSLLNSYVKWLGKWLRYLSILRAIDYRQLKIIQYWYCTREINNPEFSAAINNQN